MKRQISVLQAVTHLVAPLDSIASGGCESYTGPYRFNCFANGKVDDRNAYGADRACFPCIADRARIQFKAFLFDDPTPQASE